MTFPDHEVILNQMKYLRIHNVSIHTIFFIKIDTLIENLNFICMYTRSIVKNLNQTKIVSIFILVLSIFNKLSSIHLLLSKFA